MPGFFARALNQLSPKPANNSPSNANGWRSSPQQSPPRYAEATALPAAGGKLMKKGSEKKDKKRMSTFRKISSPMAVSPGPISPISGIPTSLAAQTRQQPTYAAPPREEPVVVKEEKDSRRASFGLMSNFRRSSLPASSLPSAKPSSKPRPMSMGGPPARITAGNLAYDRRFKPVPGLPPMTPVLEGLGIDVVESTPVETTFRPLSVEVPAPRSPSPASNRALRQSSRTNSTSSTAVAAERIDEEEVDRPKSTSSRRSSADQHAPPGRRLSSSNNASATSLPSTAERPSLNRTPSGRDRGPPPALPVKSRDRQLTPPRSRRSSNSAAEAVPTAPAGPTRGHLSNPSITRLRDSAANHRNRRSLPEGVARRSTMVDMDLLRASASKPLPQVVLRPTQNMATQTPADWNNLSPTLTSNTHWIDVSSQQRERGRASANYVAPSPSVYSVHSMAIAQDTYLRGRRRASSKAGSIRGVGGRPYRHTAESTYDDDGYQDEDDYTEELVNSYATLPPNLAPATTPRGNGQAPPSPPASNQGYNTEEEGEYDIFPSTPDFNKLLAQSLQIDSHPPPPPPSTDRRSSMQIPRRAITVPSKGRRASQPNLSLSYTTHQQPTSLSTHEEKKVRKSSSKTLTVTVPAPQTSASETSDLEPPSPGIQNMLPKLQATRLLSDAFSLGPPSSGETKLATRRASLPAKSVERSHRELTRAEKGRSFFLVQALESNDREELGDEDDSAYGSEIDSVLEIY